MEEIDIFLKQKALIRFLVADGQQVTCILEHFAKSMW